MAIARNPEAVKWLSEVKIDHPGVIPRFLPGSVKKKTWRPIKGILARSNFLKKEQAQKRTEREIIIKEAC
ncbi:MAG: hypothetical protein KAQ63_01165 [Candidatus Moranbacteria bacterium]|nr:hypothetical protein [Candidatus Moranbacteria bacterium]